MDKKNPKNDIDQVLDEKQLLALEANLNLQRVLSTYNKLDGWAKIVTVNADSEVPTVRPVNGTQWCNIANLLDLCGSGTTGKDGGTVICLKNYICPELAADYCFQHPINFLATPNSIKPFFLTRYTHINDHFCVIVKAWDHNGMPAAGVHFNWRCQLQLLTVV